jgi:FtsH-binding integral membrane protein
MATMTTMTNLWRELQFGRLDKEVKTHLQKVYTTMGLALIACAVGSYIHLSGIFTAGLLTFLGTIGALLGLYMLRPSAENEPKRFGLLMLIAGLTGVSQGPLLHRVIDIDPSIVMTAFLATAFIFVCFSLAALLSDERKFLALGGVLLSGLSWLLLFGFLNVFFKSELLFQARLYIGLAIFCGFILYDTQLIVQKRQNGDSDYIGHCLDLFLDFINLFRILLVLLSDKETKRDKRRKD